MGEVNQQKSPFYEGLTDEQIKDIYSTTLSRISRYSNIPAEDIVSDAMLRMMTANFSVPENTDPIDARKGFMYVTARRLATNYTRLSPTKSLRSTENLVSIDAEYIAEKNMDAKHPRFFVMPTQEEEVSRQEVQQVLDRALGKMRPEWSTVVRLFYAEGLSYPEIANKTGMPIGSVCSRVYRGRRQLIGILEKSLEKNGCDLEALFPVMRDNVPSPRREYH